jgi:hypothetical protein
LVKCCIDTIFWYRYDILWDAPIVLVGYSFGGLVLKSLVVEVQQHIHQRIINLTDDAINKSYKRFLETLKGTIFMVCHMLEVMKVLKYIFRGNVNKSIP